MKTYEEIETNVMINEVEIPCTFSFEYEAGEKSYFNGMFGGAHAETSNEVTLTSVAIEPKKGKVFDLCFGEFDWLLTEEMRLELENEARQYAINYEREAILDSQIAVMQDAA